MIRAMGCSLVKEERDWVKLSANKTERFTDSWINPAVEGLPLKRHSAMGRSRGSNTQLGKVARDECQEWESREGGVHQGKSR